MMHIITMRDWSHYGDLPGERTLSFGTNITQWGLLLSWGLGWCEVIVLCFQVTLEWPMRPAAVTAQESKDDGK